MKTIQAKLNNVAGQIEGIKKMIDGNQNCLDVLTQLKAVKSAVAGIMDTVADKEFDRCLKTLKTKDKQLLIKLKKQMLLQ